VEEENQKSDPLTQVHLENSH